jgi:hypothetical protein
VKISRKGNRVDRPSKRGERINQWMREEKDK